MSVKKIEIRPKGTGDYADILYPKTSADMVVDESTGFETTSHVKFSAATGSANTYAVTFPIAPGSYYDGMGVAVKINVDSTASSTLNVNGLGAKPLKKADGSDVTNLKANGVYTFRYNSTTGNFILQGEGGGGGLWLSDWSAYQTIYNWSGSGTTVTANTYGTLLDVPSGEGVLTFVRCFAVAALTDNPDVRITVDGAPFIFVGDGSASLGGKWGNLITQPIHFKTSLKIEAFNRNTVSSAIGCDYTYLLRSGTPDTAKQSILQASLRSEAVQQTGSTIATDVVNITGSGYLLGVEFSGYYVSTSSLNKGTIVIDGVTKMNGRQLVWTGESSSKLHYFGGPIRFTSSLRVQHCISESGSQTITKLFYTLD